MLDIANHFLTRYVKQPTRGHNILGLVITTYSNVVTDLKIQICLGDSDAIIFDMNLKPTTMRKQPRKVFIFKKGNMEAVRNYLKHHFEGKRKCVRSVKLVNPRKLTQLCNMSTNCSSLRGV